MDYRLGNIFLLYLSVLMSSHANNAANIEVPDCHSSCPPKWSFPEPSVHTVTRVIGESVSLRCPGAGKPHPTIEWRKDGQLVQPLNNRLIETKHSLVVRHLVSKDSGIYTCILENAYGRISWDFKLSVGATHTWLQNDGTGHPNNVTVTEGETTMFRCDYNQDPGQTVTVKWVKEMQPTGSGQRDNRLVIKHDLNDGTNDLKLIAVNVADSGRYTCIINTPTGAMERSAWLNVLPLTVPDEEDSGGPVVSSVLDSQSEGRGGSKATKNNGLVTYFKGVGISLGAMVGLLACGLLVVAISTVYRAIRRLDQRQERL